MGTKIKNRKYSYYKGRDVFSVSILVNTPLEIVTTALPEVKLTGYVNDIQFGDFSRIMCACRNCFFNMKSYTPKSIGE